MKTIDLPITVVLEGLPGSGTSTLSAKLKEVLQTNGVDCKVHSPKIPWSKDDLIRYLTMEVKYGAVNVFDRFHLSSALRGWGPRYLFRDIAEIEDTLQQMSALKFVINVDPTIALSRSSQVDWLIQWGPKKVVQRWNSILNSTERYIRISGHQVASAELIAEMVMLFDGAQELTKVPYLPQ